MSFKDLASKENSLKKTDGKEKAATDSSSPSKPTAGDAQTREEVKN